MMPTLRKLFVLLITLQGLTAAVAQSPEAVFQPYAELLQRYVVEHDLEAGGLVSSFDYRSAIGDDESRALIEQQRRRLAELDNGGFENREAAIAFWVNAYNFFMIAYIVENPENGEPVDSVKDFGSFFLPFRVFGLEIFDIAGSDRSLDQMEKEILLGEEFARRGWKDARVHFAVNCASLGCPPLRDRIYTAENVDALLAENTRRALLTPLHLRLEEEAAWLSSLFDWYEEDFEQAGGSVEAFIVDHLDPTRAARFEDARRTRFIDYDWELNSPDTIRQWLENNQ